MSSLENAQKPYYVHPTAICESGSIGSGTRIWAFSHVMAAATVGERCNLGEQVFIESGVVVGNGCTIKNGVAIWNKVTLEDDVFVGPNAVFTNDLTPRAFIKRGPTFFLETLLRQGCTIGANATLRCGVTIGRYGMVGAGSVVTKDVPDHALVMGNPARAVGRVCFCGGRLDRRDFCRTCKKTLAENSASQAAELFPEK